MRCWKESKKYSETEKGGIRYRQKVQREDVTVKTEQSHGQDEKERNSLLTLNDKDKIKGIENTKTLKSGDDSVTGRVTTKIESKK